MGPARRPCECLAVLQSASEHVVNVPEHVLMNILDEHIQVFSYEHILMLTDMESISCGAGYAFYSLKDLLARGGEVFGYCRSGGVPKPKNQLPRLS